VRAAYRGANTRLARTVSNPGDGELADEIASVRNQHRSVCATLRSGMSVEEVFCAIETLQHSFGSIDSDDGIEGHGIGFSAFLEPELRRGTQAVLPQTGAFVIDTKRHHSRLGTIRFADTLLVTKAGAHNLTDKHDARELST
jgi:Xaa-Pro aminopeptidase